MSNFAELKQCIVDSGITVDLVADTIIIGNESTLKSIEVVGVIACIETLALSHGDDVSLLELLAEESAYTYDLKSLMGLAGLSDQ